MTTVYIVIGYEQAQLGVFGDDEPAEYGGEVLGVCTTLEAAESVRTKALARRLGPPRVTVTEWSGEGPTLIEVQENVKPSVMKSRLLR
jgi:hypothetical protein